MPHQNELSAITNAVAAGIEQGKQPVILSDFDYTLCFDYTYDAVAKNHTPIIDEALIDCAKGLELVIATSRRAENPAIDAIWASGLIAPNQPIIAENGGTILANAAQGGRITFDQVHPSQVRSMGELVGELNDGGIDLIDGQQFVKKLGRTMAILRVQDANGDADPHAQHMLANYVASQVTGSDFRVVDNRVSVSLQHESVDKADAFRTYIKHTGRLRDEMYVIGMGDGPNDAEIFAEADISVGLSEAVAHLVDVPLSGGNVDSALLVLRSIKSAVQSANPHEII